MKQKINFYIAFRLWLRLCPRFITYARAAALAKLPFMLKYWLRHWHLLKSNKPKYINQNI
jgi:hypothetical protein